MDTQPETSETVILGREISALREEVETANIRMQDSLASMLGRNFLIGIAFGLGSFLGATLVVSLLIYSLSSIDFIPIVGEWAVQIADRIRQQ